MQEYVRVRVLCWYVCVYPFINCWVLNPHIKSIKFPRSVALICFCHFSFLSTEHHQSIIKATTASLSLVTIIVVVTMTVVVIVIAII